MRDQQDTKPGIGAQLLVWRCILLFSLCSPAWAVGPPSLQIAHDPQASLSPPSPQPQIAIIIDDLGYNWNNSRRAADLPGAITLSVLPFSPYALDIAKRAQQQNKELMLHAPMSSVLGKPLDEGALTPGMPKAQFLATLQNNLAALPHIQGVNNHMGSELTQQYQPMAWLMQELRQRQLYFVDSRTIAASLAWETALNHGVPTTRRDVFLDNDASYPAIAQQFGKLLLIAKQHGHAVAIAHPYPETLRFLEAALPMLNLAGVELVPVSHLLSEPSVKPRHNNAFKRVVDQPREVFGFTNYLTD